MLLSLAYHPIFPGDLVLLWTLQTHMSGLATAVTHLCVLALCKACFVCLRGLILIILLSCPVSSPLVAVMLVVTQYVHCLSNVNRILVVVH